MMEIELDPGAADTATRTGTSRHEPVFLLAPARSYSTVSLALLAGHPRLYGFPEIALFTGDSVGELFDGAVRRYTDERWEWSG